ncbi:MAG TPA: L-2-hydroxyglutarate oxidase [Solirubrobacteraceae bacterium]|nr:L-2-hydroxyglutarate oxidase [Solirubrobacteraceae bacterium]
MRVAIVGGGILGLALARLVVRERPDAGVLVLEKERDVALHQTGRNSGVVHAGLYYEPGSLKARLCRRGAGLLRAYCADHGLAYDECGKVVVATEEAELERLARLHARAVANGVPGAGLVDGTRLRQLEPHAAGLAALHSPHTAIVDFAAVARALADDVRAGGGELRLGVEVARVRDDPGARPRAELADGTVVEADAIVVCAGLHADRLARASGQPDDPRIVPFRGEYWALRPERTELVRGLIYPVPDPALPFLGVHLTRRVDGTVLIGPNAVLALAREGYRRRDVDLAEAAGTLRWSGTRRLARRHWRAGAAELARSASRRAFVHAARRYVPALRARDVVPAAAGVRAQAVGADGRLLDDFRLATSGRVTWVRNAPSPAATSSLAIAEELLDRIAGR